MAHLDLLIPVRWSDLDAYGHVNNAATMTLLEEARIAAFWEVPADQVADGAAQAPAPLGAFGAGGPISTVIASTQIEYARPLLHRRDGAIVRLWVSRLGGASFALDYLVLTADDPEGERPYARARTVIVLVDAATGAPVRLPEEARPGLEAISGEPLVFRG